MQNIKMKKRKLKVRWPIAELFHGRLMNYCENSRYLF